MTGRVSRAAAWLWVRVKTGPQESDTAAREMAVSSMVWWRLWAGIALYTAPLYASLATFHTVSEIGGVFVAWYGMAFCAPLAERLMEDA